MEAAAPFFLLVLLVIYLLPSLIAWNREHFSLGAIVALNILLGWTALGWIAAFVWSLTGDTRKLRAQAHYDAMARIRDEQELRYEERRSLPSIPHNKTEAGRSWYALSRKEIVFLILFAVFLVWLFLRIKNS